MRRLIIALTTLAIVLPAVPAQAAPAPRCTKVTAVASVLDGQYASVTCPQGSLTVAVRAGQALPALGPASVASSTVRKVTTYTLVAAGQRYGIVR